MLSYASPHHLYFCFQVCDITTSMFKFHQKGVCQRDSIGIPRYWWSSHYLIRYLKLLLICECLKYLFALFVGLLALTTGPGERAQEILEESFSPIIEALKSKSDASKISAVGRQKHILEILIWSIVIIFLLNVCIHVSSCWSVWLLSLLLAETSKRKQKSQCKPCGKWFIQNLVLMYVYLLLDMIL